MLLVVTVKGQRPDDYCERRLGARKIPQLFDLYYHSIKPLKSASSIDRSVHKDKDDSKAERMST